MSDFALLFSAMSLLKKSLLREELLSTLKSQLEVAERAHQASIEGATHEEAKPENDKDTRALEQSYLARGQALRLIELKESVTWVQSTPVGQLDPGAPCSLGALVQVEFDDGQAETYWLAPAGGGTRLAQGKVQVLTPKSPLGRALIGNTAGACCEAQVGGRLRSLELLRVS